MNIDEISRYIGKMSLYPILFHSIWNACPNLNKHLLPPAYPILFFPGCKFQTDCVPSVPCAVCMRREAWQSDLSCECTFMRNACARCVHVREMCVREMCVRAQARGACPEERKVGLGAGKVEK